MMIRHTSEYVKIVPLSNCIPSFKSMASSSCSSKADKDDVLFHSPKGRGVITLNRPKVLNALNLSMVNKIYPTLKSWQIDKKLIIIKGAGSKAFCAGGDITEVVLDALEGGDLGKKFCKAEYMLNYLIHTFRVPYIALIDGIVMGAGSGLAMHGSYRIATENTVFAMPETRIGFFPDAGASYFLNKLRGKLGTYLGLSGRSLKGMDNLYAGVATHYCESSSLSKLEVDLLACSGRKTDIDIILKYYAEDPSLSKFSLSPYMDKINSCFNFHEIEDIIRNLENDGSEWACDLIDEIYTLCPTSLKVTLKQLTKGRALCLAECLRMEYRLAYHFCEYRDFFEGVRALLLDRDNNPEWDPPCLEDVRNQHVDRFFCELNPDDELQL